MNKRSGLTLFEVIISVALSAVIVLVLQKFSGTVTNIGKVINQRLQVQQDLEQTLQTMVTEIRSAGPSASGAYSLESVSSSSIVFFGDIERDGAIKRVRYFFGTSTLQKGVTEPTTSTPPLYVTSTEAVKTVISNVIVGSSSFQYFGEAATSTASPLLFPIDTQAVRFLNAIITADVATSSAPKPITFSKIITIRNLRSN